MPLLPPPDYYSSTEPGNGYKACFGTIHAISLCSAFVILEIVVTVTGLLTSWVFFSIGSIPVLAFWGIIVICCVVLAADVSFFYSVVRGHPMPLLLFVAYHIIWSASSILYFGFILVAFAMKKDAFTCSLLGQRKETCPNNISHLPRAVYLSIIVGFLGLISLQIWLIIIGKQCFIYVKDRYNFRESLRTIETIGPPPYEIEYPPPPVVLISNVQEQ